MLRFQVKFRFFDLLNKWHFYGLFMRLKRTFANGDEKSVIGCDSRTRYQPSSRLATFVMPAVISVEISVRMSLAKS